MSNLRLEIRNLSLRFGDRTAADSINLTLEAGQVTCLLGPSGCGKSTTLRIIAGVEPQDSGEIYTATAQPAQDKGSYIIHHGYGFSRFKHQVSGLSLDLLHYVPLDDAIKISRLTIHNESGRKRRLSVTAYVEWVLGTSRSTSDCFITSSLDANTNTVLLHNRWGMAFPKRVAFVDMAGAQTAWTTDRSEFIGRNGTKAAPRALSQQVSLSGTVGAGYDHCSALQTDIELADGESREVIMFIG